MLVHLVSKGSTFSAFYSEKYPNRKKRNSHPETLGIVNDNKTNVSSETSAFLPFTVVVKCKSRKSGSEPINRASELINRASEPINRASEPINRASEPWTSGTMGPVEQWNSGTVEQ